ncbi:MULTISPECIES: chitobiase/beta-hexosaminidase C-terminal domain-containing protein [unclassified Exiguobacterium]|uniref:chitobiase/beta-hexosaminidase C-terminal domain-containing protein n=1 Tax=unclassified Exiguobacterium TaxID=2644629 RepID=UPI00103B23CF|nr:MULTISPECIES: chitobiase/beta-hexosaminidase C-terminal domain-containing protein [unclassified Exiguobacterium]TCI69652.1 endonuclease/exonuclease/phosphatase [Exiguobacterium sp. IPCI3]TCI78949.1 endonuclease/exonuclease/phosphatase [Exiguobacterium sp. IPCH1]TCI81536.1 endonuclease/exonuclease/phosphatase [Exiguobacterium sp. IPBC4]
MGKPQARSFKQMTGLALSAGLIVSSMTPIAANVHAETLNASDLFISEYVEGSSNNKAIELFNGTNAAIDLSAYKLELYSNGGTAPGTTLNLTGTLEPGGTYVIVNASASDALKAKSNTTSGVTNFNGDDTLVLKKGDTVLDVFGQVGFDPGTKWGTTVATADQSLVRKDTVTTGDANGADAFDPATEWNTQPIDTFTNLGSHTFQGVDYGDGGTVEPPAPVTPISISDARTKAEGETVTIKGIVTAKLANTISIQDATGGLSVRPTSLAVNVGDEVVVTGAIGSYRELLQLNSAVVVSKQAASVPTAQVLTGEQINEDVESELVTVNNVTLSGSGQNLTATDGTKEFVVRDERGILDLQTDVNYSSITGIVQQFDNTYQIIPRDVSDTVIDASVLRPATAKPGAGTFVGPQDVTLSTTTAGADIYYTLDGSDPKVNGTLYTSPVRIEETKTLKVAVKSGDAFSAVTTFEYKITDKIRIHDIQGASHTSPMNGQTVEGVEGVVTYSFVSMGTTYYYIQTPDMEADQDARTSEGIILYGGRSIAGIQVGDLVNVKGLVSEYAIEGYSDRQQTDMKMTQIDTRNGSVNVVKSGVALPTPVKIDASNLPTEFIDSDALAVFNPDKDAIDFWESLEGMRVETGNLKSVSPQQNGDLVTVLEATPTETFNGGILLKKDDANPERIQFRLEPNADARDFDVATGDRFNGPIVGVVGYSYGNYKIQAGLDEMKAAFIKGDAKRETTFIEAEEDKLTIASYNLENFSNNVKETSDEKALKLAKAFVEELNSPDIIGVTEVQDNNGEGTGDSAADQSYQRLIDNIVSIGGKSYKYVNIDPEYNKDGGAPNANIRVGFLYDPERVSLTEGIPAGDATTAVGYENGKLTHNPGRIDPLNPAFNSSRKPLAAQFDFQGENVVVIANHWNSKGGDTGFFGSKQPVVLGSEVQRKQIAQIVHDFVADVKTDNPDANVVALGDFNDFEFSDAMQIFKGDLMTNMVEKVPAVDRYSYVYQGNSQVLDHILVSNRLAATTEIDMIHVNADFTEMSGRASDHDPVLAQIDLTPEPEVELTRYTVENHKAARLVLQDDFIGVTIGKGTNFKNGIFVRGAYTELTGDPLKNIVVQVKPKEAGAIIDFDGATVKEVIVDGTNLAEIRGAENVKRISYTKGASANTVVIKK